MADDLNNRTLKALAIYGAGGFGREVACMINKINAIKPTWNLIGFFDDGKLIEDNVSHFGKILGNIDSLNKWDNPLAIVLCMGNPNDKIRCLNQIENPNIYFPNLIDPSFCIADYETFVIGKGNIIKASCSVTTNVRIGDYNLLNGFVNIGHDVNIGDFNVIMPGVRISGEVTIGNTNLLGADSFIKQRIRIGNEIVLSPLSALLTNPKDGYTYIGNPAKKFKF